MMPWSMIDPRMTLDHLGHIPLILSETDPRPLREQIDEKYAHGGGFRSGGFKNMVFDPTNCTAKFPGDPPMQPLAKFKCRDETLYFYRYSIIAVVGADGSYAFSRMD